jgi:rRNA maturation endonuclease Nob1
MEKIVVCNHCGNVFNLEDSINCPFCGCASVYEKEDE